jgi:hypothetical protein
MDPRIQICISVADPGCFCRTPDTGSEFSIPDPGHKDPGSGSATLIFIIKFGKRDTARYYRYNARSKFFLLLRVIFALLDPDPIFRDPDPIGIRIRNPACFIALISLKDQKKPSHATVPLKGPKREIFGLGIFAQIRPIWIGY